MKKTNPQKNSASASKAEAIDETDRRILQVLQDDFPVAPKPWLEISRRLNLDESEVLARLRRLVDAGVVNKIGPSVNSSEVGLKAATLVAFRVPKNKVDQVAAVINTYDNVSHNYEREHEYNVWFTLAAPTEADLASTLQEIKRKAKVHEEDTLNLPTVQRFKINVHFQLTG